MYFNIPQVTFCLLPFKKLKWVQFSQTIDHIDHFGVCIYENLRDRRVSDQYYICKIKETPDSPN